MNALMTTLHYATVYPIVNGYSSNDSCYITVVLISTTISLMQQFRPDLPSLLIVNRAAAFIWFMVDLIYASEVDDTFFRVLTANLFVAGWWVTLPPGFYAVWLILSCIKCYYVSTLLRSLMPKESYIKNY